MTIDSMPLAAAPTGAPLLDVRGLSVEFGTTDEPIRVLTDVSFALSGGETVAIVGESGSGKSTTALAVMRLLDEGARSDGSVALGGRELTNLRQRQLQGIRGAQMSMIFQDALTSLNPVFTIGWQLSDLLRRAGIRSPADRHRAAVDLLRRVHIPDPESRLGSYPFQLSGGLRQRALIAMAIAQDPQVLIADEPTTALDVTVKTQILDLLREIQDQSGMGILLISHDLGLVAEYSSRVLVMYGGRIVEEGQTGDVLRAPRHPYTVSLLRSVPKGGRDGPPLAVIPGSPPDPATASVGCRFADRCFMAQPLCSEHDPDLLPVASLDHRAACHFADELEREGVTA